MDTKIKKISPCLETGFHAHKLCVFIRKMIKKATLDEMADYEKTLSLLSESLEIKKSRAENITACLHTMAETIYEMKERDFMRTLDSIGYHIRGGIYDKDEMLNKIASIYYENKVACWEGEKRVDVARVFDKIGKMYEKKDGFEKAVVWYEAASKIKIFLSKETHKKEYSKYMRISRYYRERGKLDDAIMYCGMVVGSTKKQLLHKKTDDEDYEMKQKYVECLEEQVSLYRAKANGFMETKKTISEIDENAETKQDLGPCLDSIVAPEAALARLKASETG